MALPAAMAARFELGAAVGRGTSGTVYRGRERQGGEVAVKLVSTKKMARDRQDQLLQEIGTLKRCSHANIVGLIDFYGSTSAAQVFIIMEWCGYGDLEGFIARTGVRDGSGAVLPVLPVLAEPAALHFMRQLAAALRFLRSIDIVHGDLKPANLLLTAPSSSSQLLPRLKVGDFGLAQSLAGDDSSSRLHGTALYLAPELVTRGSFSASCDIWSTGAILHKMLYGYPAVHPPGPDQNDLDAALRRIASYGRPDHLPPKLPALPEVSQGCLHLLLRLLQPAPEDRLSFADLWVHECVNLPRLEPADTAAAEAEASAAAVYGDLDGVDVRAKLFAAKQSFLDAGQLYLALERDRGSGVDAGYARQRALEMIQQAEELSDAATQLPAAAVGEGVPERPEPEPEPENPPQQQQSTRPSPPQLGQQGRQQLLRQQSQQQQRLGSLARVASAAVAADAEGRVTDALRLYTETIQGSADMEMQGEIDPAVAQQLRAQFGAYSARIEELKAAAAASGAAAAAVDVEELQSWQPAGVEGDGGGAPVESADTAAGAAGGPRHVCSSACETPCLLEAADAAAAAGVGDESGGGGSVTEMLGRLVSWS